MNQKFKRIVALVLSLIMILSVAAVAVNVFAADANDVEEPHEHKTFFQIFSEFFNEVINFFKYIFHDVFLGKPAPDIPPAPVN